MRERVGAGRIRLMVTWALLLVALSTVEPVAAAYGQTPGVLAVDSVTPLHDPGTTLAVPADGRLNGYRFTGRVLGVATGTRLGTGTTSRAAAAGQKLWVFGLAWTAETDDRGDPQPVTTTLVVDGARISFPAYTASANYNSYNQANTTWNSGSTYWVASVPANATDVAVEMAAAGYSQTFSLVRMAREGPQPEALYRNPDTWQTYQPLSQEKDLPTPDPTGFLANASMPITLSGVSLSWFGPDNPTDQPSDPGTAWLYPQLNNFNDANPGNGICYPPLPGSAITLTLPGQTPMPAKVFAGIGTDKPGVGAFTDGYAFQVPAGITSAVLTVTPGTMQAQTDECIDPVALTATGSAVFDLTLPTASYQPPADASSLPARIRVLSAVTPSAAPGGVRTPGSGSGFPLLAVVLSLIGAALLTSMGIVTISRRKSPPSGDPRNSNAAPEPPASESHSAPETAAPHATTGQPQPTTPPVDRIDDPNPQPLRTILLEPPDGPPELAEGQVEVQVMGVPRIVGLPSESPSMGQTALEILVLLAFHRGERLSADQIRTELGRGRERDLDPATIRRYINDLRRILGDRIPEARSAGGYELLDISTDAGRFDDRLTAARAAADLTDIAGHLAAGLSLVRGAPFAGGPPGAYGWADTASPLAATLANRIHSTAIRLAELALSENDYTLAGWAVRQGLLVWPTDSTLNGVLLKASSMSNPPQIDQTWTEITARYLADRESPPQTLYEQYRRLKEGRGEPEEGTVS